MDLNIIIYSEKQMYKFIREISYKKKNNFSPIINTYYIKIILDLYIFPAITFILKLVLSLPKPIASIFEVF